MRKRIENDHFFPVASAEPARVRWVVPEEEFYDAPRPPVEASLLRRAAAHPMRFGGLLFAAGWIGILLQLGFLRQLVVGAPIFEEFAKFGAALVIVHALGAQRVSARLPWAWLSGAAFGVFEHFAVYSTESLVFFAERVAFHAGATGLSMALFTSVEPVADVRTRWVATIPASVLHWANNFGALVVALLATVLPLVEQAGIALAISITVVCYVLTFATVIDQDASRRTSSGIAHLLLPRAARAEFTKVDADRDPTSPSTWTGEGPDPARPSEAPPAERP